MSACPFLSGLGVNAGPMQINLIHLLQFYLYYYQQIIAVDVTTTNVRVTLEIYEVWHTLKSYHIRFLLRMVPQTPSNIVTSAYTSQQVSVAVAHFPMIGYGYAIFVYVRTCAQTYVCVHIHVGHPYGHTTGLYSLLNMLCPLLLVHQFKT